MAPQFVKPYVKTNKNDAARRRGDLRSGGAAEHALCADEECRAAGGAGAASCAPGIRQGTYCSGNQIRGLLAEFGIVIPQGHRATLPSALPELLEDGENEMPGVPPAAAAAGRALKELDRQVGEIEHQICCGIGRTRTAASWRGLPASARSRERDGGHGRAMQRALRMARQVAAWLGMVPRQDSTGGKPTLARISKRGDTYLRTLLIHGARAVIRAAERKPIG